MKAFFGLAVALAVFVASPARAVTITEVKSPGGITAWLVEDHSVPVVAASIAFRGGAALDPDDKAGLATFTTSLLDEGAGDLDTTAYQSKVEDLSASVNFDASQDMVTASLRTLTANVAPSFDLFRLALTAPRFDPAPVERVRAEMLDALSRDQRQPNAIASRLWWKSEFANNPYGRSTRGTPESVGRITPDDMRAFVKARFAKDMLTVAVVGDITPVVLKPLLDRTFGDLPEHGVPDANAEAAPRRMSDVLVSDLSVPQSVVLFGQQGLKRNDPDWYAGTLLMQVLGAGGLTSRLALEVREKRGLVYSISANLYPLQRGGLIIGQLGSQNSRVAQAIDIIRQEWKRMHDEGPTAKELADAKTYLTGSFPLSLDSTGRIASTLVAVQFDHLGIDYLDRRDSLIEQVTLADVKRVAQRLLDPEGLFFVVVGAPADLSGAQHINPGG